MTSRDDTRPKSALTPKTAAARAERERRLAEALRANLRRRKDQSRGRAEDAEPKKSEQEPGSRREE
jgi:hypothetical protein